MQSLNGILIGLGQSITDALGNVWTITPSGQVAVNGKVDNTTANVTHLAYANGLVWQENRSDLWWSKTSPSASWSPTYGTATVPVGVPNASANNTVLGVSVGTLTGRPGVPITDAGGNTWSILKGQVTVNGVIDPTTANVTELAYVNGKIWQENSQGLWWSKTAPAASWGPAYGTTVNPVSGAFIIGNAAGDRAVINVGLLTVPPNGGNALFPQQVSEVVTTGVKATGTTITIPNESGGLVVNGNSSLTASATLNLIGAYRTPSEIAGPLQNNGVMTVNDSSVEVGTLSGNGSMNASNGSTLSIQTSGVGTTIHLRSSHLFIGGLAGLAGGRPGLPGGMSFLAPITMDQASAITLNDTQATSEIVNQVGGSIREVFLYNGATEVADLKIRGVSNLYATENVAGGSVTLNTTPSSHNIASVIHTV